MIGSCLASTVCGLARRGAGLPLAFSGLIVLLCGCDALNPAFVSVFDTTGTSGRESLPSTPGHVVVAFSNQTDVDEQLLDYLLPKLNLSDAEAQALVPRIRMRVRITYSDQSFEVVEFQSGSTTMVDPEFAAVSAPDLDETDFTNFVAVCDVASVQQEPGTNIEVFIPVELTGFELVETTGTGGEVVTEFEPRSTIIPQFRALGVDEVDEDGDTVLQRNIGVRYVLSPVPNVICGSVVVITVQGTLAVPFDITPDEPSFDQDDEVTVAQIGGRYKIIVILQ